MPLKFDPMGRPVRSPVSMPQVTARDPRTGMKATSTTRGGAIAKLEAKLGGKRVPNPFINRK
jgi:hypothetical protein